MKCHCHWKMKNTSDPWCENYVRHTFWETMMDGKIYTPKSKPSVKAHIRYHTHPKLLPYPSKHISIRMTFRHTLFFHLTHVIGGIQEDKYAVVDMTRVDGERTPLILEEVDISRAMFEIYEGGVVRTELWKLSLETNRIFQFMHQGLTFIVCMLSCYILHPTYHSLHILQVKEISHDSRIARVVRADVNWITSPRSVLTNLSAFIWPGALETSRKVYLLELIYYMYQGQVYSNVDAIQTYRIKEIKGSPHRAYYGSMWMVLMVWSQFQISCRHWSSSEGFRWSTIPGSIDS